jgi:hypothetical protein
VPTLVHREKAEVRLEDAVGEDLGEPDDLSGLTRRGDYRRHPRRGEGLAREVRVVAEVVPLERGEDTGHPGEVPTRVERPVGHGRAPASDLTPASP